MQGDGEMAARIRALDWSRTALGPVEQWPSELRTMLGLVLQSSAPMALYWGPTFKLLYNDAWAHIPAERHPWALGRPGHEVWDDIWDVVGPQFEGVRATGEGVVALDQLLMMKRRGRPRETWWNYSLTPIKGPDGSVLGILNEGLEVTERVQLEQRQDFLLRFSDALRELSEPRDILRTAQRMLGEQLGANRVGYGETDPSERYFTTLDNWVDGVDPQHGIHDLSMYGAAVHAQLKRGEMQVIEDMGTDPRTAQPGVREAFKAIDVGASLTSSLVRGGRMVAALYVHTREPRAWSPGDITLVEEVAQRTWAEIARARAEAEAHASEERYRRIFDQASDLIVTSGLDRVITSANPAAAAALGLTQDQLIGRKTSDFLAPESREISESMLAKKIREGGTTRYEVLACTAHGEDLYLEVSSGLASDEKGNPIGVHLVARDITARKRWENHQRLLVGELNHRVKNTLSIVQSLSHQTFRPEQRPEDSIKAFEGRIQALAAAHNLLTRENWEAASLNDLVAEALHPFCLGSRCSISGPPVRVPPQTAVSLALALHELATNASKYGALHNDAGIVSVAWRRTGDRLSLEWREEGGPNVSAPLRQGFGTRMLSRALARELGGTVTLTYDPGGVRCLIEAPLP
ncbi:PAS domain S-box protein [Sphingomonas sp. KRR8]|uniref:PAS domain-containing sensor histidine kinase n=1 Tax=Sphingomonas sp. KRR8 TaxID=2942996 RepID=UPI0020202076|nr:HWE histidine kinase domain-containing protein [Sphingomonas sp. KRR8]URD60428.1 PAS domain S-box protein [Sphingomonas sp. KRR8]